MVSQPKPIVLATRPERQNHAWNQSLLDAGYRVVNAPMLAIEPVADEAGVRAIKNQILKLDEYDLCIFVSQNAVHEGFKWIDQYWPQFPLGVICFGVGQKTTNAIRASIERQGGLPNGVVTAVGDALTSEELLELPLMREVNGKKILIFRGCGGRTKIHTLLSQRGALVENCELYVRQKQSPEANASVVVYMDSGHSVLTELKKIEEHLIVPLFSGETLLSFHEWAQSCFIEWSSIPLVLPSERVAKQAHALNFNRITVAKNAAESSMLSAIETIRG